MDWAERYATPLSRAWTRTHKLRLEHRVEAALVAALEDSGVAPPGSGVIVRKIAESTDPEARLALLDATLDREKATHHDIAAMAQVLAEAAGPEAGPFVHWGATSQDINDCVLALQLRESRALILEAAAAVRSELARLGRTHRDLVCVARTHGQHAVPTTLGCRFANHLFEITQAAKMLERVQVVGKFAGAVGTFASFGGDTSIGDAVLRTLKLEAPSITTQVASRLYLADFVFGLAAISAATERLAKEIRNGQRTEIGELAEGFDASAKGQVGSSAMPHKRNPHKSERVCGISRLVRHTVGPILENVAIEHERDLTNSSVERTVLPQATVLTHFMLLQTAQVLATLHVDEARIAANLEGSRASLCSEQLLRLISAKTGDRHEAHEMLRLLSAEHDFESAVRRSDTIRSILTEEELDAAFEARNAIGCAPQLVDRVLAECAPDGTPDGAPEGAPDEDHKLDEARVAAGGAGGTKGPGLLETTTYASAGVSVESADAFVNKIKSACISTRKPWCDGELGGFGSIVRSGQQAMIASTDGVGTKLLLAETAVRLGVISPDRAWHDIGTDLVAMSVNDAACHGATRFVFLDYLACGSLNTEMQDTLASLIKGVAAACSASNAVLAGGETAEMPGMYPEGRFDAAGFAIGLHPDGKPMPHLDQIRAGDAIVGVPSTGLHANGFSLVRKLIEKHGIDIFSPRIADALLKPTALYVPTLAAAATVPGLRSAAHITGGGLPGNVGRALPPGLGAELDAGSWPVPPVFMWLRGLGVSPDEMLATFNLGIGLVLVASKESASRLAAATGGLLIGRVTDAPTIRVCRLEESI